MTGRPAWHQTTAETETTEGREGEGLKLQVIAVVAPNLLQYLQHCNNKERKEQRNISKHQRRMMCCVVLCDTVSVLLKCFFQLNSPTPSNVSKVLWHSYLLEINIPHVISPAG